MAACQDAVSLGCQMFRMRCLLGLFGGWKKEWERRGARKRKEGKDRKGKRKGRSGGKKGKVGKEGNEAPLG